jgi:SAM-dependent methyltransferase
MSLDKWTSGAAYDQWMGRWSRLVADEFLKWLALEPGLRYLDVCCGSGVLTQAIVERGSPADIAGIDASADQIAFARAHRTAPGVTFYTGDALNLPFPPLSFDVAVCGLGLNFVPDPERALDEMRRALAPDGKIAVYVWDYADGARFLREFWDAAVLIDPGASAHDQARRFPLCQPDALQKLFERAKLRKIEIAALHISTAFPSFDDFWLPLLSGQGSAPNYLASRGETTRDAIREQLRQSLPIDAQGAIVLPARAWAIRGQR